MTTDTKKPLPFDAKARTKRRSKYLARLAWECAEIERRNHALAGRLPFWPQPRFLSEDLERIVANEISERPLHGVPSVFRTAVHSLTNIAREKNACDRAAAGAPVRRRPSTFLSLADQEVIKRRLKRGGLSRHEADTLRARLRTHKRFHG